ncbi:MAG: hypothetical protein BRD55_06595 [Bacteroidetes bacterium SW_9_63_38]|nr:MAG: hypothetical protein BRD55_06595 [Bacteroidetes bacterium SW_9_63_38]
MGRFRVTSRFVQVSGWGLVVGLCVLVLAGCGRGTFLGRQYDDFTAYYNKFYNAKQAFEDGLENVEKADRPIDRTVYLPVFAVPDLESKTASFKKAVRKSAGVLRKHPNSKWVDDALLIIGKSYFYQGSYAGAAQKFREAVALQEGRTQEARFWLARTLVTNEGRSATEALQAVGPTDASNSAWAARLLLLRGQLRVQEEQWAAAAQGLAQGLAGDVPDRSGARASFLLGQVHETLGQSEKARSAYRLVRDYDSRYELGFAARLSEVELQGRHGDAEEALDRLRDLQKDDKNLEKRGAMARVEAQIHRAQGRPERARAALRRALYADRDGSLPSTGRARLHYELASLYRDAFEDFGRAAAHFDTAGTSLSDNASEGLAAGQRLPSAPTDAQAQARQYQTLANRAQEVARLDSLLRIGRMDEAEYRAFLDTLRRRRLAQAEQQQEQQQRTRRLQARGERQTTRKAAAETGGTDAGFLFYKNPTRVQEGQRRFREIWGDRPRVDNWRRRSAIQTAQQSQEERPSAEQSQAGAASAPEAASLDLSDIPRDSASRAEMADRQALARYELGNSLLLAAGQPDSAATWYRRVLQQSGDHPVAQRALYALAEAQRIQGDTLAARSAYQRLIEQYPQTDLAQRARRRLGLAQEQPRENRAAQADSLYARAYEQWQGSENRAALERFLTIAKQYPDTKTAPRALLASAVLYWKQVQAGMGTGPRRLVDRYLGTSIASDSASVDTSRTADTSATSPRAPRSSADSVQRAAPQLPGPPTDSTTTDTVRATGVERAQEAATEPDSSRREGGDPPTTAQALAERDTAEAGVRADSVQSVPDSMAADLADARARADSLAPLTALLRHLTEQYPDAPQVKQAQSLQTMIAEQKKGGNQAAGETTEEGSPSSDSSATDPRRPTAPTPAKQAVPDSGRADAPFRPEPSDTTSQSSPSNRTPLPGPTTP